MKPKKENEGIGGYQREKAYCAQRSILKALSDGQWHRNMELKETSKLSSRTLAKHLDMLQKARVIVKKRDVESGKYPVPVFYKAQDILLIYMRSSLLREEFSNKVDAMTEETRDPLMILDVIHDFSQLAFIRILRQIQEDKKITWEQRNFLEEFFLWSNYKYFTMELIEASMRIVDKIDIDQLLMSQAKRKKEACETIST